MDIKITDYNRAEDIANKIKKIAEAMLTTFNSLNADMNRLHGAAWQSNPSSQAHEKYKQFQTAFEKFYNEAMTFSDSIIQIVNNWRETNAQAANSEENVMDEAKPV